MKFYKQLQGATMGSPVSPVIANIYMEHYEYLAIPSISNINQVVVQVCWWCPQCHQERSSQPTHEHLNFIDPHIKFTTEVPGTDDSPS